MTKLFQGHQGNMCFTLIYFMETRRVINDQLISQLITQRTAASRPSHHSINWKSFHLALETRLHLTATMALVHNKVCLSIVIFLSFYAFAVHCIDSHGNAIYTFMELSQLLDEWCAEVNWTKTFMSRLITCRHALTVSIFIESVY